MSLLTVFTPTYNRAHTLPRLYESLTRQNNSDFEWVVVDDGSNDGTANLIKQWQNEQRISIHYEFQDHCGKAVAHNRGALIAKSPLFICIDSDDYLVEDGISTILNYWKDAEIKNGIAGIIAYRAIRQSDGKYQVTCRFPKIEEEKLYQLYQHGFVGDTAIVMRTEIVKNHPFVINNSETFVTENFLYNQIDLEYDWILLDQAIINCEYLPDGYTTNYDKICRDNPLGMLSYFNFHSSLPGLSIKNRIRDTAQYIYFSSIANYPWTFSNSNNKGLVYIAAKILAKRYLRKDKVVK